MAKSIFRLSLPLPYRLVVGVVCKCETWKEG